MSSNRHKTTMCNVCGKVMWNHNLKRHLSSKHANDYNVLQHGNTQRNANIEDEIQTKTCKVEMLNELPVSDDAKLYSSSNVTMKCTRRMLTLENRFLFY